MGFKSSSYPTRKFSLNGSSLLVCSLFAQPFHVGGVRLSREVFAAATAPGGIARIDVANVWATAAPDPVCTTAIVEEQGVVPAVTIRQFPSLLKLLASTVSFLSWA